METVVEDLIAAMENEVEVLKKKISEIQGQRQELDKAMKFTESELLRLDGRQAEAQAVLDFLRSKTAQPEDEPSVEEDTQLEN